MGSANFFGLQFRPKFWKTKFANRSGIGRWSATAKRYQRCSPAQNNEVPTEEIGALAPDRLQGWEGRQRGGVQLPSERSNRRWFRRHESLPTQTLPCQCRG